MSTLGATLSMLEVLPKESQAKVFRFTQELYSKEKEASPFMPLTEEQILSDLEISRKQAENGEGLNAKEALVAIGKKYDFV